MKKRKLIALLLVVTMLIAGCGTGNNSKKEVNSMSSDFDDLNRVTVLTVKSYVQARLLTDLVITSDINTIPREEISGLVEDTMNSWAVTEEMANKMIAVADDTKVSSADLGKFSLTNALNSIFETSVVYASETGEDASTWANRITGQFDATKGRNRLKQLGEQLGMDAKSAFKQLEMAQNILQGEAANEEGDLNQKWQKMAETTKTVCKTGIFVGSAVLTAGATTAAAGAVTLGEATGIVVGGVDVILDVGTTTSNIVMGEGNNVSVGFDAIKSKFGPASFVFGLNGLMDANKAEKISFIGESIVDWILEGKVAGIAVGKSGVDISTSWIVDTKGKTDDAVNKEILKFVNLAPKNQGKSIKELLEENVVDLDKLIAAVNEVLEKRSLAAIPVGNKDAAISEAPAPDSASSVDIVGKYVGTSQWVDANGKAGNQKPDPVTFKIRANGEALLYVDDEGVSYTFVYDSIKGIGVVESEGVTLELVFDRQANPVTVSGVLKMFAGDESTNVKVMATKSE